MRTELVICDKKYVPVELTFGNLARLEDVGIEPLELGNKPLKAIGGYVAITVGCSLAEAQALVDRHLSEGGNLDDISGALAEALDESDFFQTLLGTKKPTKKKA